MLCAARGVEREAWLTAFEEIATTSAGSLATARERAQRQADDIGTGYRIAGENDERPWPLSPVPLMIGEREWQGIADGIVQRADLMEAILQDIYGEGKLVSGGRIPAALVTGSPFFLRPMQHLTPPGGYQLQFFAADLCRDPTGEWRVLADHLRAGTGSGYALENRLAIARMLGGLQSRLNISRHAPFFAALRDGIAALCNRSDPRIGLLTAGRYNQSYAEQAHLARYLGFLLVEGADLSVLDDTVYVRTIAGMKRIDALLRRLDPRMLDPLTFDSKSTIGVPGLIDAMAMGNVVLSNAPRSGALEAPAFSAYLPALALRMTGQDLKLPNIATWWCGDEDVRDHVERELDRMLIGPAFGVAPLGLPDGKAVLGSSLSDDQRELLLADLARRPQDYVGQEIVHLSTMPVANGDGLVARPFTLRVFAARGPEGEWSVLPGGFARIGDNPDPRAVLMGEGSWSADVCVHCAEPVDPMSLLPAPGSVRLRRNPGTLPSRVADNMFWLGRYLERGEALLTVIRVLLGNSISADTGAALAPATLQHLVDLITGAGAAMPPPSLDRNALVEFARAALEGEGDAQSVRAINRLARTIGDGSRERLAADMVRLLEAPFPQKGGLLDRAGSLQRRYAALAGLSAEHMARTDAWAFHDLGRRVERAQEIAHMARIFLAAEPTHDDLLTLLDLADSQISYRQRYMSGVARAPAIDLIVCDPGNPRGLAFQIAAINAHLAALPVLSDDGIAEPQQAKGQAIAAKLSVARAERVDAALLGELEQELGRLSDAISRRYFLQGAEPLRAEGLTLA
ncbi:circularly permuted type 2 ATP-grasp protein [Sphingomonadaceae bacterium LXI357]|uniref:Circularly permuted type 2 ATP-grasp protein n=2 Tax=Stakelama marina TaxID=2826939 RepID=A0A8T4IHH3_9SPHN|nr:circularly permuted type 2 ATP-grasp protein [Stakelama marina]